MSDPPILRSKAQNPYENQFSSKKSLPMKKGLITLVNRISHLFETFMFPSASKKIMRGTGFRILSSEDAYINRPGPAGCNCCECCIGEIGDPSPVCTGDIGVIVLFCGSGSAGRGGSIPAVTAAGAVLSAGIAADGGGSCLPD